MENIQYVAKNLQITKIVKQDIDMSLLFPHYFRMASSVLPDYKKQFLSICCGGSSIISSPFSVSYPRNSFFLLLYTKSGGVRLPIDGGTLSLTAGSFVMLPMDYTVHLQSLVLPWVYEIYYIDASAFPSYKEILSKHFSAFSIDDCPSFLPAVSMLKSYPSTISSSDFFSIHASLTEVFSICCIASLGNDKIPAKIPSYLMEIHALIHEHYNITYSLSALEMQFNVSRFRICREYTHFYGISLLKDQTLLRLNCAKKMLLIPDMKIQDISSSIGYENTTHFINLFKKYFQTTPGAFRQKALASQSPSH